MHDKNYINLVNNTTVKLVAPMRSPLNQEETEDRGVMIKITKRQFVHSSPSDNQCFACVFPQPVNLVLRGLTCTTTLLGKFARKLFSCLFSLDSRYSVVNENQTITYRGCNNTTTQFVHKYVIVRYGYL